MNHNTFDQTQFAANQATTQPLDLFHVFSDGSGPASWLLRDFSADTALDGRAQGLGCRVPGVGLNAKHIANSVGFSARRPLRPVKPSAAAATLEQTDLPKLLRREIERTLGGLLCTVQEAEALTQGFRERACMLKVKRASASSFDEFVTAKELAH